MRCCSTKDRDLTIGSNHGCRMRENTLQILLAHSVKDAAAAAALNQPKSCLGGVFDGGLEPSCLRDFSQMLTRERRVPIACNDDDVLGVSSASFREQNVHRFGLDPGTHCRIF